MAEENHYTFTVRQATEAEWPGVIDALTSAFEHDPVMNNVMGGDGKSQKVRDLFGFQIRHTYGPKGTVDVAVTEEGKILGAALWLSPEGQKGGLIDEIRALPEYAKILGPGLLRAAIVDLKLLAARPKFPHWLLYTIGVHEDARGHSIGSHLLDFRRFQLGELPAYLEASTYRSAKLYAQHGFVELFRFKSGKPVLGMLHPAPVTQVSKNNPAGR